MIALGTSVNRRSLFSLFYKIVGPMADKVRECRLEGTLSTISTFMEYSIVRL
jgi:hypothetical protein